MRISLVFSELVKMSLGNGGNDIASSTFKQSVAFFVVVGNFLYLQVGSGIVLRALIHWHYFLKLIC